MAETSQETVFDVDTQQVAGVYAKALLGAAEQAGKTDDLVAELGSLIADVLDANPDFERILGSFFVNHEEKEAIIDRVLGSQASPMLLSFLKVLSAHQRLDTLRATHQALERLHNELRGRVEVTLSTPGPVDDALRAEITESLKKMLGADPVLSVVTDPTLLAGAVVKVGDTVYDGSVKTRLKELQKQMIDRTVEQIDTNRQRFL